MIHPLPFDFVISYNQEDAARAERVHHTLEVAGLSGWIDRLYHFVPNQSLEQQLSRAWSMTRFIIVLAPGNFRDSEWCQVEYGQGLAAERELPLKQVLVLYELTDRIPATLRGHPRFLLTPAGLEDLSGFLREHRIPTQLGPDLPLAIERRRISALELDELCDSVDPAIWAQLRAVDAICSWTQERLTGETSSSPDSVHLTLYSSGTSRLYPFGKEKFLHCVFSGAIEVDGIPFQRVFYDVVLFGLKGESELVRAAVERVVWGQLPLLACAPNRFFREQMIEVAAELGFRASFALADDPVHKHFNSIDVSQLWNLEFDRSELWSRRREVATLLADCSRLASPIEHALLSRWQARRAGASRLLQQLATAERVALAGRACLLMFRRYAEEEVMRDPLPRQARILGLSASHSGQHLGPNVYLETFYWTMVGFLGRTAFRFFTAESVAQIEGRMPPYSVETLSAIEVALRSILPQYVEVLDVWRLRRKAAFFNKEIVVDLIDHILRPYAVLSTARVDVVNLRTEILAALQYLDQYGDSETQSIVALLTSELDRPLYFDTTEFMCRLLEAIDQDNPTGNY